MKKKENDQPIVLSKNQFDWFIHYSEMVNKVSAETEDQLRLDFQKWLESEKSLCDKSGDMPYCAHCEFAKDCHCTISQEERLSGRCCAKAFKKYQEHITHERYKNFVFPHDID